MENKKTAVEWLIEQVNSSEYQRAFGQTYVSIELIEQAKDMEMNQISDSWNDGNLAGRNGWIDLEYSTGKGYYKETYGK